MSFNELAWKRKSIRNFKADEVPIEKITLLLDAARSAPSGGNRQPWHFYVIRDAAVKKQIFESSGGQHFISEAPVNIVVCADLGRTSARYGERGRSLYSIQDTAAAIENLLLCAADEGLAACWCGAFDEQAVSDVLNLDKNFRPVAVIPVGYAVNESPKTPRRPIEEITTFIGFDGEAVPKNEPQRIKIEHSNMSGALLNDLNLENSEFSNINMRGFKFSDINLSDGKISDCNLTNMKISNCKLVGFTVNGKRITDLLDKE
ncbi:MAG TPA: nitroreductase family protein [Oscillospiraceae bacterium]|nr:nitroreductase family protein [Oscillospiraceae bacterium]HPS35551.1 nitroreductase family protein [Oscillospiraceae bacterium]